MRNGSSRLAEGAPLLVGRASTSASMDCVVGLPGVCVGRASTSASMDCVVGLWQLCLCRACEHQKDACSGVGVVAHHIHSHHC